MKKHYLLLLLIAIAIFSSSCRKTVIQVKVDNQYGYDVYNVIVGTDNFGTVSSGQTTGYMNIPEGNGNITGQSANGLALVSSYSFSGTNPGNNPFTINISSTGTITMTKD